jgi:hypothetical protein
VGPALSPVASTVSELKTSPKTFLPPGSCIETSGAEGTPALDCTLGRADGWPVASTEDGPDIGWDAFGLPLLSRTPTTAPTTTTAAATAISTVRRAPRPEPRPRSPG